MGARVRDGGVTRWALPPTHPHPIRPHSARAASVAQDVVAAIAAALFTIPLCSLGEWIVHGVLYHNPIPGRGVSFAE